MEKMRPGKKGKETTYEQLEYTEIAPGHLDIQNPKKHTIVHIENSEDVSPGPVHAHTSSETHTAEHMELHAPVLAHAEDVRDISHTERKDHEHHAPHDSKEHAPDHGHDHDYPHDDHHGADAHGAQDDHGHGDEHAASPEPVRRTFRAEALAAHSLHHAYSKGKVRGGLFVRRVGLGATVVAASPLIMLFGAVAGMWWLSGKVSPPFDKWFGNKTGGKKEKKHDDHGHDKKHDDHGHSGHGGGHDHHH